MPIGTQAKYHHLIPRTYLSAWEHGKGTLNVEFFSEPGAIISRNKDNIAGITEYHSIKAGMPICTQSDTDLIFASLSPYKVILDGKQLSNTLDMNKHFAEFDKWTIIRQDGTKVSKKPILREIEKVKIRDIEQNWSDKYENNWSEEVSRIENNILNFSADRINEFDKEYIMKFFVALDWRSFTSNEQFNTTINILLEGLEDTEIPQENRIISQAKTAKEEMRHYLLLNYYRQYLNDTGVMFEFVRPSQNLCKPPMWCRIGAPHWRYYYEQQKESQPRRTGPESKDTGTPAGEQHQQHGGYPGSIQGDYS